MGRFFLLLGPVPLLELGTSDGAIDAPDEATGERGGELRRAPSRMLLLLGQPRGEGIRAPPPPVAETADDDGWLALNASF